MRREKAVVVLSGDAPPAAAWAECEGALVVAADGGGNHLHARGLVPDLVVGDMDSIRADALAAFEAAGARVVRHARAKLHADGTLALDVALDEGAREVVLLAATGGRLDLTLATFHLLRRGAARGARMRAVAHEGALWTATPEAPVELALARGTVVSVIPLSDVADGVRVEGCRWPLEGARMASGDPFGVSNEANAPRQRFACASGLLAIIVPRVP